MGRGGVLGVCILQYTLLFKLAGGHQVSILTSCINQNVNLFMMSSNPNCGGESKVLGELLRAFSAPTANATLQRSCVLGRQLKRKTGR